MIELIVCAYCGHKCPEWYLEKHLEKHLGNYHPGIIVEDPEFWRRDDRY